MRLLVSVIELLLMFLRIIGVENDRIILEKSGVPLSSVYKQYLSYYSIFYTVHLVVKLHLLIVLTYKPGFLQIADLFLIILVQLKEVRVMQPLILSNQKSHTQL